MGIQVGDILGDYRVTGVLGRGGMGKVLRVRNLLTDREEAMKIVLPDLSDNSALADRFLREMKVHASLQHPNIATLHTALRIGDRLVMILELVEGYSLEDLLRHGPLAIESSVRYTTQVLSALAYAHGRGVIHRDIKPANILIDSAGLAKLTDFGIARSDSMESLTGTGVAVGTLAYMSPEQIRSAHADARSDIYSLGLTLYETITGRRAIQGDTEHALMNAQLTVTPPEPASIDPRIPAALSQAIMRAVAKDPAGRFPSASGFAAAIEECRGAESPAPPASAASGSLPSAELAQLEVQLSRAIGPIARRLVAEASRRCGTIAEIRQTLAAEIEDLSQREVFLKTKPPGETAGTAIRTPTAPASFDAAHLDRVSHALAPYLGPIAKVMVGRAAKSARSLEGLYDQLAGEIAAPEDRRRFLAAVRSLS